jgi:lipopolysaccharide export system ATP-binding protein
VTGKSILKAINLRKSFGKREVVRGVSIEVRGGEIVGLLGPNGAGKTTTFSMIAGFVKPTEGRLEINGKDITRLKPHQRAKQGLVYLSQESSVFRKLSVEDNIRAIAETLKISRSEREELVKERLEELGLTTLAKQKAHTLSGGERRRLEITRALVLNPDFLLLDEPFSGVDPKSVSEVNKIMNNLKSRGIGILITDHNVRETLRVVDSAYLLYQGEVLAHGDAEFLTSDQETRQKYLGDDFEN